jgi:hypothetical protein
MVKTKNISGEYELLSQWENAAPPEIDFAPV